MCNGGPFERAALLMRAIGLDHPFADGNKRTAFEAADTFLERNGIRIEAELEELIRFMLGVAQGEFNVSGIAAWLRKRRKG